MKTVLVTGASGFVGRHIVHHLSDCGHRVFATEHLTPIREDTAARCEIIRRANIKDPRHFLSVLRHCDSVIHAAAYIPADMTDIGEAWDCMAINGQNSLALAEAAREADVGRFIYLSTAQMYVPGNRVGKSAMTEGAPVYPNRHAVAYMTSKLAGELYVQAALEGHGTAVILRLGSVYGPGSNAGAIGRFVAQAAEDEDMTVFGEGSARFTPVWIGDVADIAERATMTGHGAYNVVGDEHISVLEAAWEVKAVAERIWKSQTCTIRMLPDRPEGAEFPLISNTKATQEWGIRFATLTDGLLRWMNPPP